MGLFIVRLVFIMVASALGVSLIKEALVPADSPFLSWAAPIGMIALALAVIGTDIAIRRKQLDTISAVYFGLIIGLFLAYVLGLALNPLFPSEGELSSTADIVYYAKLERAVQLILASALCYICISLLMQTRHDFRFLIPYVEFSKEIKGRRPYILDTSVIIDGRIADVVEAKIFDTQLVIPRFVIGELQAIADSSDRLRRSRGRRGLDILNRLQNNDAVDVAIFDRDLPEFSEQPVDLKLVTLAKHINGKLVTNDYNLNKVARLHGVGVINLNDLANALKPVFLPGETISVVVLKPGEEPGQGVAYLEDGTMVVIEAGRDHVNSEIKVTVTSVLQTSAGRMVFGRYEA